DETEAVEEVSGSGVRKGDFMVGKPSVFDTYNDVNNYRSKTTEENTTIFVGKANEIIGYFSLADQVRSESTKAVAGFQDEGIRSDETEAVEEVSGSGVRKGDFMVGKPSVFDTYNDVNNYRSKTTEENTTIFVGKANEIIGYFSLADQVRSESTKAVAGFQDEGIHVALLTGDN